ncbi:uncharacterized protein LOC111343517 [Stylophora pistillata]|uniref:uncharacterized protein LOC111343517 n=1 Tax=Stylophora pistillata TaxID=50429 RepID=UPI000C052CD5|nr:uncharacterized protein LOC111343517 [Stylophora pistillata]
MSANAGLRINKSKTKGMKINTSNADRLESEGEDIEEVEDLVYLGSNISKDGGADRDVQGRIGKARTALTTQRPVWNSKTISRKTKLRIFNTNVKSLLLYGSETWRITKATSNKLQCFVNKCLRSMMDVHLPEVIRNEDLCARTDQERIDIQIRRHKWGWIGHSLRKPSSNVTRHALRWNPQGKRKQGRPRNSWRRAVDKEAAKAGYTWNEIEKLAWDRRRWHEVSLDLCSTGSEKG